MSIALTARVQVAPGKGPEFEVIFAEQAKFVRESEPGNRLYQLVRSRADPLIYLVMELYDDAAAVETHRNSEHLKANRPRIAPLLAGPTSVEMYDVV